MNTMQEYLTAQYEDDKPPRVCPYCQQWILGAGSGTVAGGMFHPDCAQQAIREGRLKYSHGYAGSLVYSEWGSKD